MTTLDSTHTAAVDHAYHWQPMTSCPKGSKVQLLTRYRPVKWEASAFRREEQSHVRQYKHIK